MFLLLLSAALFGLLAASATFGFSPQLFLAGAWRDDPFWSWLSPLASAFLARDFVSPIFNLIFLLIAGRFVEKAIRPVGLGIVFLAGAYGGALARLILTPNSLLPSAGLEPALFAVLGAYFMLYGVPRVIPIAQGHSRSIQIAILAGVWLAIQIIFQIVGQSFEMSVSIVEPIGGLVAGVALARPLLAWQYRKA
ncbi:membrane associated rhomboid family serine protease [Sphingomonas sp. UYAg733]